MRKRSLAVTCGLIFCAVVTAGVLGVLPTTSPTTRLAPDAWWESASMGELLPGQPAEAQVGDTRNADVSLLARIVSSEAQGEPATGQTAVAAVILNRVRDSRFPKTLSGVIFQPHAFESVSNGLIWQRTPDSTAVNAARQAINGWDPTYGCVFFWNPSKPVSRWIWSRKIVARIGNHVFAH